MEGENNGVTSSRSIGKLPATSYVREDEAGATWRRLLPPPAFLATTESTPGSMLE